MQKIYLKIALSIPLCLTQISFPTWKEDSFSTIYMIASYLSDPICNVRKEYWEAVLAEKIFPELSPLELTAKKCEHIFKMLISSGLAIFTTLPAIVLRHFAQKFQSKPFLYCEGKTTGKEIKDNCFTLLSWNICCPSAGYAMTDGGVTHWTYRMDPLLKSIKAVDADILCLYEVFDIQTAKVLIEDLKDHYAHFFFHMGQKAIGFSSGLFVATKITIENPKFDSFSKESLAGRAKYSGKGVFGFDVLKEGKYLMRIFTTHLGHSEVPSQPTPMEKASRQKQIEQILLEMEPYEKSLLTGDYNLDDKEMKEHPFESFEKGESNERDFTWGGDAFAAKLMYKPTSHESNLDHTMVKKEAKIGLKTILIENRFDQRELKPDALSDHRGLKSTISLEFLKNFP